MKLKSYYPEGIRADSGTKCIRCHGKKRAGARFCHKCKPVFSSHSSGEQWCEFNASGPCVFWFTEYNRAGLVGLIYNRGNFHHRGEWPEEPGRGWG